MVARGFTPVTESLIHEPIRRVGRDASITRHQGFHPWLPSVAAPRLLLLPLLASRACYSIHIITITASSAVGGLRMLRVRNSRLWKLPGCQARVHHVDQSCFDTTTIAGRA